jgi:hypothetical protein
MKVTNNYSESPSSYVLNWENDVRDKYVMLWDTLLDADDGISEEAYMRLVELGQMIDPNFVKSVSKFVDATDGRFYISTRKNN